MAKESRIKVFKFGGASVKDAKAIDNVAQILKSHINEPIVVVISAMGKTTNALETVVKLHHKQNVKVYAEIDKIKQDHLSVLQELFGKNYDAPYERVTKLFNELTEFIQTDNTGNFDYAYDQIVSIGEKLSSRIVSEYLNYKLINNTWLDAKSMIHTDNHYREANVVWEATCKTIQLTIPTELENGFVLTQGFIGSTPEMLTTTLGREGSDYSAAIFAHALYAEKLTLWKDVSGILSADPNKADHPEKINHLNYFDLIEMSYYGAKVVHPKTIRPLQNKKIDLEVRSFLQPAISGTLINEDKIKRHELPMIIIEKEEQTLLSFSDKNFHFVNETNLSRIVQQLAQHLLNINLIQNSAIQLTVCVDDNPHKIKRLVKALQSEFEIVVQDQLKLITVRNCNALQETEIIKKYKPLLLHKKADYIRLLASK